MPYKSKEARNAHARHRRATDPNYLERERLYFRLWRAANPKLSRGYVNAWYRRLREEVLTAYGRKCACCGEGTQEFLAVDHINGGRNAHFRALGPGRKFYTFLKVHGFPQDAYRLLCHNCNMAHGIYGYCPHQGGTNAPKP